MFPLSLVLSFILDTLLLVRYPRATRHARAQSPYTKPLLAHLDFWTGPYALHRKHPRNSARPFLGERHCAMHRLTYHTTQLTHSFSTGSFRWGSGTLGPTTSWVFCLPTVAPKQKKGPNSPSSILSGDGAGLTFSLYLQLRFVRQQVNSGSILRTAQNSCTSMRYCASIIEPAIISCIDTVDANGAGRRCARAVGSFGFRRVERRDYDGRKFGPRE